MLFGTQIKTENGVTQIIEGPRHSDMEGWRARLMAAFGTTSETVARVEVERIAKALRQRDGTIDPAELDAVIAIVSGQQPKNELEAMAIAQMAVTHALTMRSFGNLNRSSSIQQQDSNALTVARLTKAFASQIAATGVTMLATMLDAIRLSANPMGRSKAFALKSSGSHNERSGK